MIGDLLVGCVGTVTQPPIKKFLKLSAVQYVEQEFLLLKLTECLMDTHATSPCGTLLWMSRNLVSELPLLAQK